MRMQGYWGRVLVVDMTEETAQELPIPEEWFRAYVGGEGLAVRLFRYMADPVMPASEPDNPVVIAAGPLTGAPLDGCDLGAAAFRSPDGRGIGTARLGGRADRSERHLRDRSHPPPRAARQRPDRADHPGPRRPARNVGGHRHTGPTRGR